MLKLSQLNKSLTLEAPEANTCIAQRRIFGFEKLDIYSETESKLGFTMYPSGLYEKQAIYSPEILELSNPIGF